MSDLIGAAGTALPLLIVVAAVLPVAVAVARSLRDESVLEALRAEVRCVGEVRRAVLEARTSPRGPRAPR